MRRGPSVVGQVVGAVVDPVAPERAPVEDGGGAARAVTVRVREAVGARPVVWIGLLVALVACIEVPGDPVDGAGKPDGWRVVHVVDGDTLDVRAADGAEERVRLVGVDTPERGECGYGPATAAVVDLALGAEVILVGGGRDDRDRYDRLLRYVEVEGRDVGLALLEAGLAVARYDSRDGYGRHPREGTYVAADRATPEVVCGASDPPSTG